MLGHRLRTIGASRSWMRQEGPSPRASGGSPALRSWGVETTKKFTAQAVEAALKKLDSQEYGFVLRAKGIVAGEDGAWIHFDYVPGESNVRTGCAAVTGKLCVIGSKLEEEDIAALFGV